MTVSATSTSYSMADTTALRAVGSELNGRLAFVGLVQTADTGQVNWTTVTLPAANTLIGYEIWRFADSSIYFKLEWYTNTLSTNAPRFWLTVGTGSNGSGTITGAATFPRTEIQGQNATVIAGPALNLFCHTTDFLGVVFHKGGSSGIASTLSFAIEKSALPDATLSGEGFAVSYQGPSSAANMIKRPIRTAATAAVGQSSSSFVAVPGNVTTSAVGVDRQVWPHAAMFPLTRYSPFLCTVLESELAINTTFTATLLGSTPHTYIAVGNALGTGNSSSAAVTWSVAMLWE